jgi:hypothetical protein
MKYANAKMLAAAGALVLLGAACNRSPAYKRDQDYYKPEAQSYYDRGAPNRSISQRIEGMGQPKKRVVVLNFWNDTPVKVNDLGLFAADELRRGLHLSQRLILPGDAKTDLSTENFVNGDKIKVAQLIREGRRMGVAVLLIGRVTKVVFRQRGDDVGVFRQKQSLAAADVEIKMFDVTAGREIMATGKSGEASSNSMVALEENNIESPAYRAELTKLALRNAMTMVVPDVLKAVEKMAWEGSVAKIIGNKVYVNAGKASGLVAGDILKVLTQGDDIYDPSTGAYLGRSHGALKGTLEVVDFIGTDGAVSEVHTGGNFMEGDAVQLY